MNRIQRIFLLTVRLLVVGLFFSPAHAKPIYDGNEYTQMLADAGKHQYAPVVAIIANAFLEPKWNDPAFQSQLADKTSALLAELGDTVLQSCIHRDSPGMLYLYATPEGLRRLAASDRVQGLSRAYGRNATVYDPDHWFDDIESEIERSGSADILVVLNLENFVFEYGPYGQATYPASGDLAAELKQKLPEFLAALPSSGIVDLGGLKARLANSDPSSPLVGMRVVKEGLYCLQTNPKVRGIRLAYPAPPALQSFATEVLEEARQKEFVDVEIDLYRPLGYSILDGYLPAKAVQAQKAASKQAWDDIFSGLSGEAVVRMYEWAAYSSARLTKVGAEVLYRAADRRIQRISKQFVITIDDPSSFPLKQEGPLTARTVKMDVTPLAGDIGKTGGIYAAALVPGEGSTARMYFLDGDAHWKPFASCENAPTHYFGLLKVLEDIPLISTPTDLSSLVGTDIYGGWGIGDSAAAACQNMVNNGTYMQAGRGISP